jgi:hypothetical protein
MVRDRLGDELPAYADQVRDLLAHPGWQVLDGLYEAGLQREMQGLISRRVLPHVEYIAVTRAAFTHEVCRTLPQTVLFEAERMLDERREAEAASRREEA